MYRYTTMNTKPTTRVCKTCNQEKDLLTAFHRHHKDSTCFLYECKACRYEGTYVKKGRSQKPNGFQKLPEEVQQDILAMRERKEKNQAICDKHGIKLHTLLYWLSRKYIQ